jgi:hypothetical protein
MTLQEILDRKPGELGESHERLAKELLRYHEGLTRSQGAQRLGVSDRVFRRLVVEVVAAAWIPIVADRGDPGQEEARYRIAKPDEVELLSRQVGELSARAISAHERARGLRQAFIDFHHSGSLFAPEVPKLEGAA